MAPAAKFDTAGLLHNFQTVVYLKLMLESLGKPQLATTAKTENSTVAAFVNDTLKKSKDCNVWFG